MPGFLPADLASSNDFGLGFGGVAVPLSGFAAVQRALFTVPVNERWDMSLVTFNAAIDDVRVTTFGAYLRVTKPSMGGFFYNVPMPLIINDPVNLQLVVNTNLSGIILCQGDVVSARWIFQNSDAGAAHNVLSEGYVIRYVPFRLVSEPAIAMLNTQRADVNLDQRLRQSRG